MEFEVNKELKVGLTIMDDKHFAGIDFDNPFVGKLTIKAKRAGNVVYLEVHVDGYEYL